jgi:2-hydroxy-3-oxopropionate reductase
MKKIKNKKIGFIGLGRMGKPMATNILKAGFPLIVYDVRRGPLLEIEKLGAQVAESAKQLGEESDTVVVAVFNYEQIKEVVFASEGALGGMKNNSSLIIMSTISPLDAKEAGELAKERGITTLDAPVSGGVPGAETGTLTIMVGGDAQVLRDNEDVLKAMGQNIRHVGGLGMGEAAKMIVQILVEANIVATAEAMVMAEKLGLNLEDMFEIVTKSVGDSEVFRRWAPRIITRDFSPVGCVDIAVKDTSMIVNTAMNLGILLPVSTAAYQMFRIAQSRGFGHLHHASLIKLYEEFGGVKGYD